MLFVNDDHAQIGKRRKQRRSGADDHVQLPRLRPHDLVVLLSHGERGIDDRHPVAEPPVKPQQRLVSEGDLRDQHDRLSSHGHHLLDHAQIYLRLAAARHPVKQICSRPPGPVICEDPIDDSALRGAQRHPFLRPVRAPHRIAVEGFRLNAQDALLLQRRKDGRRHIQFLPDQLVGKHLIRHQGIQNPRPGRLMPVHALIGRLLKRIPFDASGDLLLLHLLQLLLHRQHGL